MDKENQLYMLMDLLSYMSELHTHIFSYFSSLPRCLIGILNLTCPKQTLVLFLNLSHLSKYTVILPTQCSSLGIILHSYYT